MSRIFTPREPDSSSSPTQGFDTLAPDDGILFTRSSLLNFLQKLTINEAQANLQLENLAKFATIGRLTDASADASHALENHVSSDTVPSTMDPVTRPSLPLTPSSVPSLTGSTPSPTTTFKKRGVFIVIEGLDRAGKSSQVELLSKHLSQRRQDGKVKVMKFPDRTTPIGQILNSYLTTPSISLHPRAVHLLFSANRWELRDQILKDLYDGWDIIADRYAGSGVAYSRAKGLDLEYLMTPDTTLPSPDLTLFLSLSAAAAAKRGGYGEERYEKEEMQRKVRQAFAEIEAVVQRQSSNSQEGVEGPAISRTIWKTLDAEKSLLEVFEDVKREVENAIEEVKRSGRQIGGLWDGRVDITSYSG